MRYEYYIIKASTTSHVHYDPLQWLEDRINSEAADGWRCISVYYSHSEPAHIAVMEREVTE